MNSCGEIKKIFIKDMWFFKGGNSRFTLPTDAYGQENYFKYWKSDKKKLKAAL